jgi:PQQ-dependent dehydrogenase (s-GDH family)
MIMMTTAVLKKAMGCCLALLFMGAVMAQKVTGPHHEQFAVRIVASKLSDPWSVVYGPDHYLWVTEAKGYKVSRVNPATGAKTVILDLQDQRKFPRYDLSTEQYGGKPWPLGGLMGMALHPRLLTGKPYVYLVYVYRFEGAERPGDGCALNFGGCYFKARLVRYRYAADKDTLSDPEILCDSIPQSSDHNGGRLVIAPVKGKDYLFYGVGDMGAGQFNNGGRRNRAQDINDYEGKILRWNIEADEDSDAGDQWIPNDNPFNSVGQSAVWSYGHRNPSGLATVNIGGRDLLYSCEHGPFSDDEVNRIEAGKNYGHPLIVGFADDNYNGLAAGVSHQVSIAAKWHSSYPLITSEKAAVKIIGNENYRDPLISLYPNSHAFLLQLFAQITGGNDRQQWPSEAPGSLAVYTSGTIPGWKNSLLIPTLKGGKLIRLKLSSDGTQIVSDTINYFKGRERFRDIALSPDGRKIYLAVDSASVSSGPSKRNVQPIMCRGCIIEYTYTGQKKALLRRNDR